jgi:hypothetical protein
VTRALERIDDAVPARRLGKRAVDENDGGLHEVPFAWVIRVRHGRRSVVQQPRPGSDASCDRDLVVAAPWCAEVETRALPGVPP